MYIIKAEAFSMKEIFLRKKNGADDQIRTGDLLITNQLLYRLSYIGTQRIQREPFYLKGFFLSSF